MNNQKKLIVMVITLSLILILSSSYALLRSTKVSQNNYSISIGDVEVTFQDGQTEKLNLSDMYPMSDEEGESQEKTLTFTVENIGTVGTYYDISIDELSTNPEFKSVIKYISKKDEEGYKEPKVLSENKYIELTGYIEPKQTSTYKIKVWLMEEADKIYMKKEFKAKIVVNAYQESNYAKDIIKSKLVKYEESSKEDFKGGLVAVNANGGLYNETESNQIIREYRYSGPTVNNYVTFNNETWRILGIFKDENNEEFVKIVRNEVLDVDFPITYTINENEYLIKGASVNNKVYWNTKSDNTTNNNWATGGLQYWLNTKKDSNNNKGYLDYLSQSGQDNMIANYKYYLGNVVWYDEGNGYYGIKETPKEAYNDERNNLNCTSISWLGCSGGYVWPDNDSTWIGKIGLMYPSDYGYSANYLYWDTKLGGVTFSGDAANSSWLQLTANHQDQEYLISPDSWSIQDVVLWGTTALMYYNGFSNSNYLFRPTLYLKSNVKITSGDGSINNQYKLSID